MTRKHLITAGELLTIVLFAAPPVFSQSQKVIRWPKVSFYNSKMTRTSPDTHFTDRIEEIEIEAITVEDQPVIIGKPFAASDDWLKNIRFRVKNVSDKPLKQVQITLIPSEILHGPQIPYICTECSRAENPTVIQSGAEVELTIPAGGLYAWVRSVIVDRGSALPDMNDVQVLTAIVTRADGTVWFSDCVKAYDSRNACPRPAP
jgi:hypothetical protein